MLYLVSVERGEVLTFLGSDDVKFPTIHLCRKQSIVLVNRSASENFELIKAWLPRKF